MSTTVRIRSCGVTQERQDTHLLNHNVHRALMQRQQIADTGQTLYVNIVYHVLVRNASENIPLALLQAQHQKLNMVYNGLNTSAIKRVPTTGRYAFASVIGKPNIVFLPSDPTQLTETEVIRISCSQVFQGLTDVLAFVTQQGFPPTDGVLNVYLAPLESTLGESEVGGNVCVCEVTSIGGDFVRGTLPRYDLGMTLCHESGHAMGLTHIWNESKPTLVMSDIPIQKRPNYVFEFTSDGGARNCNRMKDCARYAGYQGFTDTPDATGAPPASWLCTGSPCSSCTDTSVLFEMGCCVMDYATDANMVMFSAAQANAMRACLLSGSNGVDLHESDGKQLTVSTPGETFSGIKPQAPQKTSENFWKRNWIWISIGGVSLLLCSCLILILFILLRRKTGR